MRISLLLVSSYQPGVLVLLTEILQLFDDKLMPMIIIKFDNYNNIGS